jgi:uncharacterized protein
MIARFCNFSGESPGLSHSGLSTLYLCKTVVSLEWSIVMGLKQQLFTVNSLRRSLLKITTFAPMVFLSSFFLSRRSAVQMSNSINPTQGTYTVEQVTFQSNEVAIIGRLYIPTGLSQPAPVVLLLGPVAFVKEQSPVQYATRLAKTGFISLVFDPRFHGESGGEPRRYESPEAKVADLKAAIDYLMTRSEVNRDHLYLLGVCQGVNWAIHTATEDRRIRALAIVAGHYLTAAGIDDYTGGEAQTRDRIERGQQALANYEDGEVKYIPIVSLDDPNALLPRRPIYEWYRRWEDRGLFWEFHGYWENRITAMSEAELWTYRVDETVKRLNTPTLMIHADRAATGTIEPKRIFEQIVTPNKQLIWLGNRVQFQFYEEPETIDQCVANIAEWFNRHA